MGFGEHFDSMFPACFCAMNPARFIFTADYRMPRGDESLVDNNNEDKHRADTKSRIRECLQKLGLGNGIFESYSVLLNDGLYLIIK